MSFSTPDGRTLEPKLQVLRRAEADLLYMHPRVTRSDHIGDQLSCRGRISRVGNVSVSLQAAEQECITKRSRDIRETGDAQGFNPVDVKSIAMLSVVGVSEAAPECGPHHLVLLAEGYLMTFHVSGEIHLQESRVGRVGNWAQRNRVL